MQQNVYSRQPINYHREIPVFSLAVDYTENYEKISSDHIKFLQNNGSNPFIQEYLWIQLEKPTRDLIIKYFYAGDNNLDGGVGLGRLLSLFPVPS